jgi:hypothetical protein
MLKQIRDEEKLQWCALVERISISEYAMELQVKGIKTIKNRGLLLKTIKVWMR